MTSICSFNAGGIYGCFENSATEPFSTDDVLEPFTNYRNELPMGRWLVAGDTLLSSDGMNILTYTNEGDLILSRFIWSAGVTGIDAGFVQIENTGNLVMRNSGGREYWSTNTIQRGVDGPFSLTVQDDKNLVVYSHSLNRALWSSGTRNSSTC